MKHEWINFCLDQASRDAAFYSGCRKITQSVRFRIRNLDNDLAIGDAGFTKSKLTILRRSYVHDESRNVAVGLWQGRLEREKYGSVGFHCFNHYVKGSAHNAYWERINERKGSSKRASVMGPCIQSVSLTLTDKQRTRVDVFYRTTELFKKFPADLVFLRDILLEPFELRNLECVTFHFANVTLHPMYFVTLLPLIDYPLAALHTIREEDPYFHDWIVKWTARYVCPEHHRGIAKFAQALRVQKDANERIDQPTMEALRDYLRSNHPGHRKSYAISDEHSGGDVRPCVHVPERSDKASRTPRAKRVLAGSAQEGDGDIRAQQRDNQRAPRSRKRRAVR